MTDPAIRGGGGWRPTVLVLLAAGCAGAILVFTPLPVLLIPGIILTAVFAKLRGGDAVATLDGSVQNKDQDSGNTGATQDERCQVPSAKTTENNVLDPAAVDVTTQTSLQQVPPSLPATASTPSRRPVEVLASSTAKPTTSPQQPSSVVPTVASESPPPVQPTPTRSLVPETPPAPSQPSAPPQSSAPPANAVKAASAATTPTVEALAPAPAPTAQPSPAPVAATGGLAILSRLRQQRTDKSPTPASAPPPPPPKPLVTVLYGSQTGTSSEIARNLAAEAVAKGFNAKCSSLNELGFAALSPTSTPIVIVVASSTGDGDPPDNATTFFAAMRRKPEPSFAGMQFTLLGLGDSNYTRFMYVPRAIKSRLAELGAKVFYRCAEADEVDGIEDTVEPWMDGLWDSLKAAVDAASQTDLQVQEVNEPAAEGVVKVAKALDTQPAPTIDAATATVAAAVAAVAARKEAEARAAAAKQAARKEAAAKEVAAKEAAAKAAAEAVAKAEAEAKAAAEAAAETEVKAAEAATEEVRAAAEAAAIAGAKAAAAEAAAAEELRVAAEATAAVEAAAEAGAKATQAEASGLVEEEAPAAAAPELTSTTSQKPVPAADSETNSSAPQAPEAPALTPSAAEQKPEASAAVPPPAEAGPSKPTPSAAPAVAVVSTSADAEAPLSTTDEKEAVAAPVPAAEAEAPTGKESTKPPEASLLPGELVAIMEASVAPTTAAVGLPTIAESRVFEEAPEETDEEGAEAADQEGGGGGGEEDPLLTPRTSVTEGSPGPSPPEYRPDSVMSVGTGKRSDGTARRSLDYGARRRATGDKPPSRLQAKPINVNFPKREETVVKRKDEKTYGMLLGLAPVGVDTKGAPALLPCRIKLQWERDEGRAKTLREAEGSRPTREERHRLDSDGLYSASQPFWAHISDARYETAFWSDRKVLHLELSVRGSHIAYEPGDSIGVLPINHPDLVTNLCKRLNVNPERVFTLHPGGGAGEGGGQLPSHIPSPCSIGYVLSHCIDLTSVTRKSLLRLLSEHATDAAERRTLLFLSARGGKEAYAHEVGEHQPSVLDLLFRFRSCNPPFEALLDALPPLMPRMYSISSSRRDPARGPNHLSVAMSVVRFKTRYGTRLGVATTWLDRLAAPLTADTLMTPPEPIYVPIFLRRSADFKPPPDLATPLIMVGPGTGVAPFRGFLQERRATILDKKPEPEALGEAWLFFGCRRDDEDYLYKEELQGFKAEGTLTELHVAFSRAQADKVYVQDLLKQHGEKVWGLLQAGARVYVCGDGAAMAKDVHATLVGVVQQHGGQSAEDAASYMQTLAHDRRYIRDVWS